MASVNAAPDIPPGVPQVGEILDGKYRIEAAIGAGGMGVVVAARHVSTGHRFAIKFLVHEAAKDPEAAERLMREARAVASLRTDHAVRVYDVGRLASGAPYMVMEHLAGTHLGRLRRVRARFPVTDAVDCVLQAGEAIAEAHAVGIVHRDIKPANLFIIARPDRSLSVKVLDFGLSRAVSDRERLTKTGHVAGSPQYMAPEQMRGLKFADHRADIWSLGVVLYYILSGQRPYDGKSIPTIYVSIMAGPPPSLSEIRPEVPPGLAALVQRCLTPDLDRRVQTMAEMAEGLAPFASSRGRQSAEYIARALAGWQPPRE
jgi:eukaryotic-like serine/threonine-protein kinase